MMRKNMVWWLRAIIFSISLHHAMLMISSVMGGSANINLQGQIASPKHPILKTFLSKFERSVSQGSVIEKSEENLQNRLRKIFGFAKARSQFKIARSNLYSKGPIGSSSENVMSYEKPNRRKFRNPLPNQPQNEESIEETRFQQKYMEKRVKNPVLSDESEEEAIRIPDTTTKPTKPPFWLKKKLRKQLVVAREKERDPDESEDDYATLARHHPRVSTTQGPPTVKHIHSWKNRRVIEIGSSESIEIVRRRKNKTALETNWNLTTTDLSTTTEFQLVSRPTTPRYISLLKKAAQ